MKGMDRETGKEIEAWEYCWVRIVDRLRTLRGTRVRRHRYGSVIPRIIDRPQNQDLLLELTLSIITCLHDPEEGEPDFRVGRVDISQMGADGILRVEIHGIHFPRGHLGDYSVYEGRSGNLVLARTA